MVDVEAMKINYSKDCVWILENVVWPCVRRSIERLFDQLSESACSALDPLQVTKSGVLTVNAECRRDPKSLFMLVHVHRLVSIIAVRDRKRLHINLSYHA